MMVGNSDDAYMMVIMYDDNARVHDSDEWWV